MITEWLIIGTFVLWVVYDVFAGKLEERTESQVIQKWAWQFPAVPYTLGIITGHWFLNNVGFPGPSWITNLPVILFLVVWKSNPVKHPAIWFGIGFFMGGLTWGQHH